MPGGTIGSLTCARPVGWSGTGLFRAVGPAQPDQAMLAKEGMAVQAWAGGKGAVMGEACPVAAVQLAQGSDGQGLRTGVAVEGRGEPGLVAGLGEGDSGEPVGC